MDWRTRVFTALEHREPDRIPIDFWASKGFVKKLESALGITYDEFLDRNDVDFRYIAGPRYVGPPLVRADGAPVDIWGVARRPVEVELDDASEIYSEVAAAPLAYASGVEEVLEYPHWPSPDWFDYGVVEKQCDEVLARGRVVVFMGDRLNRIAQLKPAMYVRGVEKILVDMAADPDVAHAIFSRIRWFYITYLERILEAAKGKIDIVLTGDDFGSQMGPLISPQMWDEFIRAGFAEYMTLAKAHGARTMHHTCGSVADLIPRMADAGLEILQSLQPEAAGMSARSLKKRFGARLSFQGGVSIQKTLPFGTPDDVRAEVAALARDMGPGGGYIFCTSHNIQADTAVENVQALMAAYHACGRYGKPSRAS